MKYFKLKQIQNPQKLLSFQTTPKNLKTDRKFFPAPFLPLLVIIWGRTSTEISQPKDISCCPFRVILHNCWPPGNSCWQASSWLSEVARFQILYSKRISFPCMNCFRVWRPKYFIIPSSTATCIQTSQQWRWACQKALGLSRTCPKGWELTQSVKQLMEMKSS